MNDEQKKMRELRLADIRQFIRNNVDRKIDDPEIASIDRLSNQALHLLAAAIDNA